MTFDDRLRRELQRAIPSDPPPDPEALADALIRRAAGGGGGGGGGLRMALWIGAVAIVGGSIGAAIGLSGFFDSAPAAPVVTTTTSAATSVPTTTTSPVPVATTATIPAATTTTTSTPAAATTAPPAAATTAPDTSPPVVGQLSVAPNPIWERDTEVISCGSNPRQATVAAQVADDRAVAAVVLSWEFPGGPSGSKAMSGSGTYSAVFGPFPYPTVTDSGSESVTLTVTATDGAGNSAAALDAITVISTATCFG